MHKTRWAILENIKKRHSATIQQLAEDVSISPVTVRHHLYGLLADGLIQRDILRKGVGRPQHGYSLTDSGLKLFPSRYRELAGYLLSAIKSAQPQDTVNKVLEGIAQTLLNTMPAPEVLEKMPPQERLSLLKNHLKAQNIVLNLRPVNERAVTAQLECPYYHLSQQHPEVCHIDSTLIKQALRMPVQRVECLLTGDKSCTFSIKLLDGVSTE